MRLAVATCSVLCLLACAAASEKRGIINLDTLTFDKLIGEDRPVVVAFTEMSPYGDEWDAFAEAAVTSWTAHILFAQVALGVEQDDYGYGYMEENDNDKIANRYKAEPGDIFFFPQRHRTPTKWQSEGKNKADLLVWIKNQGVYVGLEGCIKEFDEFALRFMTQKEARADILKEADAAAKKLQEASQDSAAQAVVYTSVMKKIIKSGDGFIQTEKNRLRKLVEDAGIKEEKKDHFRKKLNILETFEPSPEDREPVDTIDFDDDEDDNTGEF